MPPVSEEAFARLVGDLDASALAAFVADLWAVRGWETRVVDGDEPLVEAETATDGERDGDRLRIRVVAEAGVGGRLFRRFLPTGPPLDPADLDDVDLLVAGSDDPALEAVAGEAGVEYLGPAGLRDRLLYAQSRGDAEAVFERHFEGAFETPDRPGPSWAGDRGRDGEGAAGRASGRRVPSQRVAVAALLVVVAVAAAAVGPADVARQQPATVPADVGPVAGSPSTTPSPTPDPYPPGLSADGVGNLTRLADAHVTAVRNRQYTLDVVFVGPPEADGFENWSSVRWRLWVGSAHNFRINATYRHEDRSPRWLEFGVYADGVNLYRRVETPNETAYDARPAGSSDATSYVFFTRSLLMQYLDTPSTSVNRVVDEETGTVRYRVVAEGTPSGMRTEIQGYRALAWVTPDGRVSSLSVEYTADVGGQLRAVRMGFEYLTYGDADVEQPSWLSEAKNRTAG